MIDQHIRNYAQNITPNTIIGGIAKQGGTGVNAPIDTPFKLANKLNIAVNRITGFRIIGNDVECRIRGSMSGVIFGDLNNSSLANQNITYYIDSDNLITSAIFARCASLEFLQLNGLTSTSPSTIRACIHPDFTIEFNGLLTANYLFTQLASTFTQEKLSGIPNVTTLGVYAFHQVSGFTELNLPTVTIINTSTFYTVNNCVNYYLNNVTQANTSPWAHGNSACKLIEMKKCKTVGARFFYELGSIAPHPTDFTMRLNIAIKESAAVVDTKTRFPWAVIEFYDDNGDYVSTL